MKPCSSCNTLPFPCSICHFLRCFCRPRAECYQHFARDGSKIVYFTGGSTRAEVAEYREAAKAGPPRVLDGRPNVRARTRSEALHMEAMRGR
jgi:hypothetical protein